MRIKGEKKLRKTYVVQRMGGGGSRGVVLHLDVAVVIGDRVRQSILPDGSVVIRKVDRRGKKTGSR